MSSRRKMLMGAVPAIATASSTVLILSPWSITAALLMGCAVGLVVALFMARNGEELLRSFQSLRTGARLAWAAGALVLAWALLRSFPVNAPPGWSASLRLLFHGVNITALGGTLAALGRWFSCPAAPSVSSISTKWFVLPPLLAWLGWWLAFFPALMTSDSTDQWQQAGSRIDSDLHPVFHTAFLRLCRLLWDSPAAPVLVQFVSMAAVLYWVMKLLRQAGAGTLALAITSIGVAVSPVVGSMVITLWKDVPFAIASAAVLGVVFLALTAPSRLRGAYGLWTMFMLTGAVAVLLRHNGFPILIGAALAIALMRPELRKPVIASAVAAILLATATRTLLLRTFEITPSRTAVAWVGYLGSHIARGTPLQPHERAMLSQARSLDDGWAYNCYSNVPTVFDGHFNLSALNAQADRVGPLMMELAARNPDAALSHLACASELVWRVGNGRAPMNGPALWRSGKEMSSLQTIYRGHGAPSASYVLPGLADWLSRGVMRSLAPDLSWFVWRPAIALYGLILAFAVFALRSRSWRPLAVLLPVLLHSTLLALVIPSQDVRYQYPVWLAFLLIAPAALSRSTRIDVSRDHPKETGAAVPAMPPSP